MRTLAATLALLAGCDSGADSGTSSNASASASGSEPKVFVHPKEDVDRARAACKEYEKVLEACIAKLPAGAKPTFESTLKAHREAMAKASDPHVVAMERSCRQGTSSTKQHPACK
jgi:hypothetical protein